MSALKNLERLEMAVNGQPTFYKKVSGAGSLFNVR